MYIIYIYTHTHIYSFTCMYMRSIHVTILCSAEVAAFLPTSWCCINLSTRAQGLLAARMRVFRVTDLTAPNSGVMESVVR